MPPTSRQSFLQQQASTSTELPRTTNSGRSLPTSSSDALLRLAKLDDSIQDALTTRNKLAADLESLLQHHKRALESHYEVAEASDRLKTISYARSLVQKQITKAQTQISEKRSSLTKRREFLKKDLESQRQTLISVREAHEVTLPASRSEKAAIDRAMHAQRRRIATTLSRIYPITPVPGHTLQFRIRGLHLPNSDALDSTNGTKSSNIDPELVGSATETTAAALGHVAHALQLLAHYLTSPLPYPVNTRSSTSTIIDMISKLPTNASSTPSTSEDQERNLRTYPLFSRGAPRFRFEYAVFLLNKDIQVLLERTYGVKVVDVQQTLPESGLSVLCCHGR